MTHFSSFDELFHAISSLQKSHPEWIRLDGNPKGGNRTVFATFQYAGKEWRIHADTRIDQLMAAKERFNNGDEPFTVCVTEKGSHCLRLAGQIKKKANGLYIYEN